MTFPFYKPLNIPKNNSKTRMTFRKIPRELSLQAITALSWLGLFICQRVQAGFIDPKQTVCIDGGSGCAKLLHNPKFILLGLHPHEWGALFFAALILLCLLQFLRVSELIARILSLALDGAAFLGIIAAMASGYAQYKLIHQICPLCFSLDCLLILIAVVTLFRDSRKSVGPLSHSPQQSMMLCNLFGFAMMALLVLTVRTADRKTYLPQIATVNGEPIYQEELDEEAAPETYTQNLSIYEAEKPILQRLIGERLLENAAKKEKKSVSEYLASKKIPHDGSAASLEMKHNLIEQLRSSAKVKSFLTSPTPPLLAKIPEDGILVGNPSAPIQIVCFSDFECPYCRKLIPVLEAFQKKYPDDVSIIYCQFPLAIHPLALPAAKAAFCAERQGRYEEFHRILYSEGNLTSESLQNAAIKCHLDMTAFNACMNSPEMESKVDRAIQDAKKLGLHGTPHLYFNGKLLTISADIKEFEKFRERILRDRE